MEKNTNTIDKIIAEMSMQCYLSAGEIRVVT